MPNGLGDLLNAYMLTKKSLLLIVLFFLSTMVTGLPANAESIDFISPGMNETLIGKNPQIECRISVPFQQQTLFIALDRSDVTTLASVTDQGFELKPFHTLPPGAHTIFVTFLDQNNQLHKKQLEFATRHSQAFETLSSQNTVSAIYTQVIKKMDDAKNRSVSDWQIESNLYSENLIGQGPWQISFKTNARFNEQQRAISEPLDKGFYFADYLLKGEVKSDIATWTAAVGDLQVRGTPNTIGDLSRRGVALGAESKRFFIDVFSLKTQQQIGDDDDEDVQTDDKDHLLGLSGGLSFMEKKLNLKATYVTGGDDTTSYNTWPEPGASKGDAAGLEITTDFFNQKLTTRTEVDWSDFDSNTSDSSGSKKDKAYLGQISGTIDFFTYDLLYEYTGTDYEVATASRQQDRKGYTARTGFSGDGQSIGFNLGRYNNNLDNDPTIARIDTLQYGANYTNNKISSFPISAAWQRSEQDSSKEPAGTSRIENTTDTFTGSLSYIKGAFVVGLQPEFSQMDDKTTADYDTQSKSLTLFSSYSGEKFSVSPSVSANRFEDKKRSTNNDTISCNFSFSINFIDGLDLEGIASYGVLNASDDTVDQNNFSGDLQLSYTWKDPLGPLVSPAVQVRLNHNDSSDKVADTGTNETIIYLILSANLDLSF